MHHCLNAAGLVFRKDVWTLAGAFSLWGIQCRSVGASLIDIGCSL